MLDLLFENLLRELDGKIRYAVNHQRNRTHKKTISTLVQIYFPRVTMTDVVDTDTIDRSVISVTR